MSALRLHLHLERVFEESLKIEAQSLKKKLVADSMSVQSIIDLSNCTLLNKKRDATYK